MNPSAKIQQDTKRVFYNQGTCSRTLFYILNREFDHPMEAEEAASDVLAGGIALHGDQCGMLWGAALAAGAEAYRRAASPEEAVPVAILTTRALLDSFVQRAHTPNCRELTGADFNNRWSMAKYLLTGKFLGCFSSPTNGRRKRSAPPWMSLLPSPKPCRLPAGAAPPK